MDEAFVGEVAHPSGHLPAEAQQDGGKLGRGRAPGAAGESVAEMSVYVHCSCTLDGLLVC